MFSSSFSLRQNIKAVDTELGDYKVSNNARVDVLETFKASLEGDAAGSIADLETKHNEQAALITTLETNATALKSRIDTFNAALEDGSDGTISTIEQIKLNKDGLTQELLDRASEDVRVEGLVSTLETITLVLNSSETSRANAAEGVLQANIDAEISARQAAISTEITNREVAFNSALSFVSDEEARALTAETALQANITLEATNRAAAVALEVVNRNNAITAEAEARATAITTEQTFRENEIQTEQLTRATEIEKLGFISTAEAEGVLLVNSYPFSFGMGNQSEPEYGLPVPFSYNIRKLAYSCISADTSPTVNIKVLHYPFGSSTGQVLNSSLSLVGKYANIYLSHSGLTPGNIVIQIVSVDGLTDDDSKFRLSFVLTSNDSLYS